MVDENKLESRPSLDLLPPNLMSVSSRTKCAPESVSLYQRSLSSTIGSFYSPAACPLSFDHSGIHWRVDIPSVTSSAIESRDWRQVKLSDPPTLSEDFKLELSAIGSSTYTDVYMRYMYYVYGDKGASEIPDLSDLNLIRKPLWDSFTPSTRADLTSDFNVTQKRAILNYILANASNRRTLSIPFIPVKYTHTKSLPRLPDECYQSVASNRSNFQAVYVQDGYTCRKIRKLWVNEFSQLSLFSKALAADFDQFRNFQAKALEDARVSIVRDFFGKCHDIMKVDRLLTKNPGCVHAAVHALLSQNLRDVITTSIHEYVNHIVSFTGNRDKFLIRNKMVLKNGEIRLKFSADSCLNFFTGHLQDMIDLVKGLHRPTVDNNFLLIRNELFRLDVSEFSVSLATLSTAVCESLKSSSAVFENLQSFTFLLTEISAARTMAVTAVSASQVDQYIRKLQAAKLALLEISSEVPCPLVGVDCKEVVDVLVSKADECIQTVLVAKTEKMRDVNETVVHTCEKLTFPLKGTVESGADLMEMKRVIQSVSEQLFCVTNIYFEQAEWYRTLDGVQHRLVLVDMSSIAQAATATGALQAAVAQRTAQLDEEEAALQAACTSQQASIKSILDIFERKRLEISTLSNVSDAAEICSKVRSFLTFVNDTARDLRALNEKEEILGLALSSFSRLPDHLEFASLFDALWTNTAQFVDFVATINASPILSIEIDKVRRQFESVSREFTDFQRNFFFKDEDAAVMVTESILATQRASLRHLEIATLLQDPRLTDWAAVSVVVGFPVDEGTGYAFSRFVDSGTFDRINELRDIIH